MLNFSIVEDDHEIGVAFGEYEVTLWVDHSGLLGKNLYGCYNGNWKQEQTFKLFFYLAYVSIRHRYFRKKVQEFLLKKKL